MRTTTVYTPYARCTPFTVPSPAAVNTRDLSRAAVASLHLMYRPMDEGFYEDEEDLSTMNCTNLTLHAGDRLYLPFGTVHRALPFKVHLTLGPTYPM